MVKSQEYAKTKWKEKATLGWRKRWKKGAIAGTENYINNFAAFLGIDPSYVRDEAERRKKGIEAVDVETVVKKFDPEKWITRLKEAVLAA